MWVKLAHRLKFFLIEYNFNGNNMVRGEKAYKCNRLIIHSTCHRRALQAYQHIPHRICWYTHMIDFQFLSSFTEIRFKTTFIWASRLFLWGKMKFWIFQLRLSWLVEWKLFFFQITIIDYTSWQCNWSINLSISMKMITINRFVKIMINWVI